MPDEYDRMDRLKSLHALTGLAEKREMALDKPSPAVLQACASAKSVILADLEKHGVTDFITLSQPEDK